MANLTKRIVEGLQAQDRAYDVRDSILRGFLVRVEPGGTKSFFLDYRFAGKRSRYRLGVFPNLSVDGARSVALVTAGDVARGVNPQARRKAERVKAARDKVSTLKAFLDARYEPWAKTHLKYAKFQLARIRSDFADQLNKQLSALNSFAIERIRHDWKKAGMKPRSINPNNVFTGFARAYAATGPGSERLSAKAMSPKAAKGPLRLGAVPADGVSRRRALIRHGEILHMHMRTLRDV